MMKMVRKHLSEKYVVQEEDLLERIAESSEKGAVCCYIIILWLFGKGLVKLYTVHLYT